MKAKKTLTSTVKLLPILLCVSVTLIYIFSGADLSVEKLLNFAPNNPVLAAAFLISLYAAKSLSIVFPVLVLNIAVGFLFSPGLALIINTVGMALELSVPYFVGRFSGTEYADKLCSKYKKFREVVEYGHKNSYFMTFFLRAINCLPMDVVSIYFGACRINFVIYLICSLIGMMPLYVFATLLGNSITDPTSPKFWLCIGATVSISLTSFIVFFFWRRSKKKKLAK